MNNDIDHRLSRDGKNILHDKRKKWEMDLHISGFQQVNYGSSWENAKTFYHSLKMT